MNAAQVLLEAAAEQRRLASEARTNNGQAEHADIADWLEERAGQMAGGTEGGELDDAVLGLVTGGEQGLGTCSTQPVPLYDHDPDSPESAIEARAAKIIADHIYEFRYGQDTEFAGERMDVCDELSIEILDELTAQGLTVVTRPLPTVEQIETAVHHRLHADQDCMWDSGLCPKRGTAHLVALSVLELLKTPNAAAHNIHALLTKGN